MNAEVRNSGPSPCDACQDAAHEAPCPPQGNTVGSAAGACERHASEQRPPRPCGERILPRELEQQMLASLQLLRDDLAWLWATAIVTPPWPESEIDDDETDHDDPEAYHG